MRGYLMLCALVMSGFLLGGVSGCAGDPNVESAKLYIRTNEFDRAVENANLAIERNPEDSEAHFVKGEALRLKAEREQLPMAERRQVLEQMTESYRRVQSLNPARREEVGNRLNAAWATEINTGVTILNRPDADAEALNRAVSVLQNATVIQPDSVAGHRNLAFALLRADRAMDAAEPFQRAIDLGEDQPTAFVYLARIRRAEGRAEDALAILENARRQMPGDPEIEVELLSAYVAAGQTDRALTAYQAAVASDPDNPLYRYNYGSLLLEANRYEEAIEQLEAAAMLEPDNQDAHFNLGAAYQNKALAVNRQIQEMETARGNRAEIDRLVEQRTALFRQSLPHLVEARQQTEARGDDATSVCRALFQVYTQLNDQAAARNAAACAGIDLN
jgi:tetratricopeptide (TPR) repeat protein